MIKAYFCPYPLTLSLSQGERGIAPYAAFLAWEQEKPSPSGRGLGEGKHGIHRDKRIAPPYLEEGFI